ncbi:membrane protein insertase YidC, partial [Methylocapsa aurea]|uniref:membrane protein insertase YidC n=1 Tax=Methylocapsa aurea TaxID=663610 RepID=UPI00056D4102
MKQDTKNLYLAIGLSCLVVLGWNMFYTGPQLDKTRQAQMRGGQTGAQSPGPQAPGSQAPGSLGAGSPAGPGGALSEPVKTRAEALAASPRIKLDTPALFGSIALKSGRIDDVSLKAYRETTDPSSPNIVLLSPAGSPHPYYAEAGFLAAPGEALALPRADTLWRADREALTPSSPVTLSYDNGQGLIFRRKIAVDDRYMFTVTDAVENASARPVTLTPYGLVSRIGLPATENYAVLHEGFVGVIGASGVEAWKYDAIEKEEKATKTFEGVGGWLGFTDKYWAATVIPDQSAAVKASFSERATPQKVYGAGFQQSEAKTLAPGASMDVTTRVFAGAKETYTLDKYQADLGIEKFDLLIDWGWFY